MNRTSIVAAWLLLAMPLVATAQQPAPRLFQGFDALLRRPFVDKITGERLRVPMGDPEGTRKYYAEISLQLGFEDDEPPATLDELLAHFGYGAVRAADAETLPSDVLMDFERLAAQVSNPAEFQAAFAEKPLAAGDILALRYFAPKTTDVSGLVQPPKYSWRKLVRLKARPDSPARRHGADYLYWLAVTYVPLSQENPFSGHSLGNQVIISRDVLSPEKNSAYWLVYGSLADGGKLATNTKTSWDAASPEAVEGLSPYHVPESCTYCHGYSKSQPKLAILDSDHWLDRVQPGDDFERLGAQAARLPVLYDTLGQTKAQQNAGAYRVLRQVNQEIARQNAAIEKEGFETRFAENWLRLHETSGEHVPIMERGIPGPNGERWDPQNKLDRQLLPLLNRYCYRCHSSLIYNVFDKAAVIDELGFGDLLGRINSDDPNYRMPQDRLLPKEVKAELTRLIEELAAKKAEK
jgi:hypothetical protein